MREVVRKDFPEKEERILAILDGAGTSKEMAFALESQQEEEKDPPEGDAWSFALQFRNALMIDRLACHADSGLTSTRLADGLMLTGRKGTNNGQSYNDLLYPGPRRLGLEPGMVILLGDPYRHSAAAEAFRVFMEYMRANR